jgi:serine/threonine protein kinase
MTPERWEQIGEIYHAAMELDSAARPTFLDEACANDAELRAEVESLIAAERRAGDFIAAPALKDAAEMLGDSPSTTLIGRKISHYKILGRLGKGGMGEVYLAQDSRLNRQVALKALPAEFANDEQRVRRFEREARAISALNHPNIITIHEIGKAGGIHFLVTEFIDGQTLRQRMAGEALRLGEALGIAIQVTHALVAAHRAGIVHRDIKPENVMIRRDGLVKALDFGLAKAPEIRRPISSAYTTDAPTEFMTNADAGIVIGTPRYMSPEQARGLVTDARTDLFSLGVTLYEMISGRPPFIGETPTDVILAIVAQEPPPLSVPDELNRIVNKALSKDRESRYQTAEDLSRDLKEFRRSFAPESARDAVLRPADAEQITTTEELNAGAFESNMTPAVSLKWSVWAGKHRRGAVLALAGILLAIIGLFLYSNRKPAWTEKDTVLLADFENKTGDEVFDETLRQALSAHLEQTPYLNLFSDDRTRESLRYMGRSTDERVTREIAREICQRQGVKAILAGSITRLDRNYSIILEAINSQTGETIASALAEAEGKDRVLSALGSAARRLRERLGESLASIQRFDAPLEQATTPSLEALKAWSRGLALARSGKSGAIPLYKHATELDPNFAKAYVSLSLAYNYQEQSDLAAEFAAKAFALRDRVTDRESFDIAANFHAVATGDLLKAIEVLELWKHTYPRDSAPSNRLASFYRLVGQFEKSLAVAREASQLNPRAYIPYVSMGTALAQLNRFDEAQAVIERALAEQLATATSRRDLYHVAAVKGDAATMRRQIEWASGKPDEYWSYHWRAQSASFAGRWREAQAHYDRAAALVTLSSRERAEWFAGEARLRAAVCGLCQQSKNGVTAGPASSRISLQPYVPGAASVALARALCGEISAAQSMMDDLGAANTQSTLANFVWLPVIRAAIELRRDNPTLALQALQPVIPYEPAALFWPNYLRGQAYLRLGKGGEASAEFRKILANRGWDALSPLYPLAHLGLARAEALTGAAGGRDAYQAFLTLWKDADPDIPILQAVKKEHSSVFGAANQ